MIRVIVQQVGCCPSGEIVSRDYRTFDIDYSELEKFLRSERGCYVTASVVGVELIADHAEAVRS